MPVETEDTAVVPGEHIVQFYDRDSELLETVGGYLVDAAREGAVAIVIATEAHRRAFQARVSAAGIDLEQARAAGRFVSLDAQATIARLVCGGRIDGGAFRRVVGGVVREAGKTGRPVRAYGEMVALLWDAGDVPDAIELERQWCELGHELQFSLLCAYRSQSVAGYEHADARQQVCDLHTSVLRARSGVDRGTRARSSRAEITARFPADRTAPGAARRFLTEALRQWGYARALVDDAELVISELATNAVVHTGLPFSVVIRPDERVVRIAVHDHSPAEPAMRYARSMVPSGRGLRLVAGTAGRWGVDTTADGKTVWADLRV